MDEKALAIVKEFVGKLHTSGILLDDSPLNDEQSEARARAILTGEREPIKHLFHYTLACAVMGVAKYENTRAPYSLEITMNTSKKEIRSTLKKMIDAGVHEEDISRVIDYFQRRAAFEALFACVETLEDSGVMLGRLLDELDYEDYEDKENVLDALNLYWGLAQFDEDGNFVDEIVMTHESVSGTDFFEEY